MKSSFVVFFVGVMVFAGVAHGQVPRLLSYQGVVSGQAIDGVKSVDVRLYYDSTSSSAAFHNTLAVPFAKGLFSLMIGPIPNNVDFSKPLYLGIAIDGSPEMTPRTLVTPAPYAFYAASSGNAHTASMSDSAGFATIADTARNVAPSDHQFASQVGYVTPDNNGNVLLHYYEQLGSSDSSVSIATTPHITSGATYNGDLKVNSKVISPLSMSTSGMKDGQTIQYKAATNSWIPASMNVPVGTVMAFAGDITAAAASGELDTTEWLPCDGRALSDTTFPDLWKAIGVANGGGGGRFNLPDYRGLFLRGTNNMSPAMGNRADSRYNDPDTSLRFAIVNGGNIGNKVGSVQADAFQGHHHLSANPEAGQPATGSTCPVTSSSVGNSAPVDYFAHAPSNDGIHGEPRVSYETRPKNAYVNWIIKVRP